MAGPRLATSFGATANAVGSHPRPWLVRAPQRPRDDMRLLSPASQKVLEGALDATEQVDMIAGAVGSSLVLTDRRLMVIRDGAGWRPTSGVRSFALDHDLGVRIGPQLKRVIIEPTGETINLFIRHSQLGAAEALVAEVRRRIHSR